MGNNSSRASCFCPMSVALTADTSIPFFSSPLDEGLGHAFCYVTPPCNPSTSSSQQASFTIISGASVSANTSTSLSLSSWEHLDSFPHVPAHFPAAFHSTSSFSSLPLQPLPRALPPSSMASCTMASSMASSMGSSITSFMGSSIASSMSSLMGSSISPSMGPPSLSSGPLDGVFDHRSLFSNPLERGFASGPLERSHLSGPIDLVDRSHFSAPITGFYHRRRSVTNMLSRVSRPVQKVISKTVSKTSAGLTRTRKSILNLHHNKKEPKLSCRSPNKPEVQWAQGKAGEDRVHIVLSESHGWLFVGIYDGFNGPDAPDFLLANLYCAIQDELQGLLCDRKENVEGMSTNTIALHGNSGAKHPSKAADRSNLKDASRVGNMRANSPERTLRAVLSDRKNNGRETVATSNEMMLQRTALEPDYQIAASPEVTGKENLQQFRERDGASVSRANEIIEAASSQLDGRLMSFLADPLSASNKLGKKSRHVNKPRNDRNRTHRLDLEHDQRIVEEQMKKNSSAMDSAKGCTEKAVDHSSVLAALARALEDTESAYLGMADQAIDGNPELALMGSCVLVMLMKGEDVYVMNVGDSRAVLASKSVDAKCSSCLVADQTEDDSENIQRRDATLRSQLDQIVDDSASEHETLEMPHEPATESSNLTALQLSSDHCTSVLEEVQRIQSEHPDDEKSVSKDRVKGNLKVTRAFGAGFLKHPKWNSALLEMFRVNYIGTSPYLSCKPSLCHHRLVAEDHFLVLSSDGLYQYFTNEEVVAHVEWFMRRNPDGDPAQHLIEELLFRAAKKAGMDFHQLLDIPQGDRRKYHDDISVMVVSLEGRMWKSFM